MRATHRKGISGGQGAALVSQMTTERVSAESEGFSNPAGCFSPQLNQSVWSAVSETRVSKIPSSAPVS